MPDGYAPGEVPLYEGKAAVDEEYAAAERAGEPFFAVEAYDQGYAVTFDLLPAGRELAPTARKEVAQRITQEVETIVGDESLPTAEVSRSVSASLGHISFFEREESARRVASVISRVALDRSNWVEAEPPGAAENRQN